LAQVRHFSIFAMGVAGAKPAPGASDTPQAHDPVRGAVRESQHLTVLRQCFARQAPGGALEKAGFDEALRVAEEQGMLRLRGTPLGHRLYKIFDKDGSGSITEAEFVAGMSKLATGTPEERLQMTFQAYDSAGTGIVHKTDVLNFFQQSWDFAWKTLSEELKTSAIPQARRPSAKDLDDFARSNRDACLGVISADFDALDASRQGHLDQQAFRTFVQSDRTICAQCGTVEFRVPVSFMHATPPPLYPDLAAPPQLAA